MNTPYAVPRAGRVFAAGTIQWAWGLDSFGADVSVGPSFSRTNIVDLDVAKMTRNVMACLRDGGIACGE